jgi:hypothetical protein
VNTFTLFTFSKNIGTATLNILDLSGKKTAEFKSENNTKEFVLEKSNIPAGVYFYRIVASNKNIASGKLVIH